MTIRPEVLARQPLSALAQLLRNNPADPLPFNALYERGESELADSIVLSEEVEISLESTSDIALARLAYRLDHLFMGGDPDRGGIA